jgi:hypothetical protein
MSDEDLSFTGTFDASGITSSIDDINDRLSNLEGTASSAGNGISSGLGSASAGLDEVSGKVSEVNDGFDIMDAIKLAAVIEAVHLLADALGECVEQFAEIQDVSTRAAMFGGTPIENIASQTEEIMKQADEIGGKYGIEHEKIAEGIGVLRQYGIDTQKMSESDLEQYAALARGMQQDPAAIAKEIMATAGMSNTQDYQRVIDIAASAYMKTGTTLEEIQRPLMQLQPMKGVLGGLEGEVATLEVLKQVGTPMRYAVSGLTSAYKEFEKSSDAYVETTDKVNKKTGEVTQKFKDIKAEGLGDVFQSAGLQSAAEKTKGFTQSMVDLYVAGKEQGKDFFSTMSGGATLEQFAANQAKIKGYTEELLNSGGAAKKLSDITNTDLSASLDRMSVSFGAVKDQIGEVVKGPAKDFADFVSGPLLDSITTFIDKIKSGDIKGAISSAFDVENLVLTYIGNTLDAVKTDILTYDWKGIGSEVAADLGKYMSNITVDAAKLGQTVAAGLIAALDFARGALSGKISLQDILFGKTPIDAFLKPIEQTLNAEFNLMAVEMEANIAKGSAGSIQQFYTMHDQAVDAIVGIINSVIDLENELGSGLAGAINTASSALSQLASGDWGGAAETVKNALSGSGVPDVSNTVDTGKLNEAQLAAYNVKLKAKYESQPGTQIIPEGLTTSSYSSSVSTPTVTLSDSTMAKLGEQYSQAKGGGAQAAETGASTPWYQGLVATKDYLHETLAPIDKAIGDTAKYIFTPPAGESFGDKLNSVLETAQKPFFANVPEAQRTDIGRTPLAKSVFGEGTTYAQPYMEPGATSHELGNLAEPFNKLLDTNRDSITKYKENNDIIQKSSDTQTQTGLDIKDGKASWSNIEHATAESLGLQKLGSYKYDQSYWDTQIGDAKAKLDAVKQAILDDPTKSSIDAMDKSTQDNLAALINGTNTIANNTDPANVAAVLSPYAETALRLGSEIGSNFSTTQGNPVRIGYNQQGTETAVIGSVAQANWQGTWAPQQVSVNLDTQQYNADKQRIESEKIKVTGDMSGINDPMKSVQDNLNTIIKDANPIAVKTQVTRVDVDKLLADIAAGHTMNIDVNVNAHAGEIRAIVESEISAALS